MSTTTPWRTVDDTFAVSIVDANGELVEAIMADGESNNPLWPEQAALIVKAVNCHEKLLAACKEALRVNIGCCCAAGMACLECVLNDAIAKAEAEQI